MEKESESLAYSYQTKINTKMESIQKYIHKKDIAEMKKIVIYVINESYSLNILERRASYSNKKFTINLYKTR